MEPYVLAMILKPLIALIILLCIVAPLKWLFVRYFPNGRIKRLLLIRTN